MSTADSNKFSDLIPFPIEPGPGFHGAARIYAFIPSTMPWASGSPFEKTSGLLDLTRRVR